jgi:hypothetical protein
MEWIYIIGLIGYYLYKAYNKGIENSTDKKKKPIQPIEQREPEKSFEDILKELLEPKEEKQPPKPIVQPQKPKPAVQPKPITPTPPKTAEPVLHEHGNYSSSIEYDSTIENVLHKKYDSVENANYRQKTIQDDTTSRKYARFKGLLVDGKLLTGKEMLIAQTVFGKWKMDS